MFRFSCFHSPNHSLKPKKTVQLPTESMGKSLEDHNANKPNKDHVFSKDVHQDNNANPFPSSPDQDWNSEGLKSMNDIDSEHGNEIKTMRKCVSLGADLAAYHEVTSGEDTSSFYGNRSGDEYHKTQTSISPQISSNFVKHTSDMSPDAEVVDDCFESQLSGVCTPWTPHAFVKSNSMPYMHLACTDVVHEYGSSNDSKDKSIDNDSVGHADKSDGDEAYDCVGLSKDWIVPATDERDKGKTVQEEYFAEDLPNENFKIKRIENWVMDLQHSSSPEEAIMLTDLEHHGQNGKTTILDPMTPSRNDVKAISGIDAAKLYISSLNSAATTAQLANHGLIVIPFLNTFSNLKALNLSGNSIVRITVGALPRGLHILNLSKNSISIIEGLRDLTRLRVLDLSYNRILRIGHGLASCSSLKELYLAGNKISEVEGLHRLLKLNVLDLRFNKLSTTKSLGQLAANYGSLQAISLEGNPAQKNIGDEQLKKFLISLVPHIAYINRKSIKGGGIKESADRAARIGIYAHQCDRGLRSESKRSRYGRKSQVVGGRGRSMRLPPSGVKAVSDRHQFPDVSSQVVSFRPDLAMRRAYSEELLRTV